MLTLLLRPGRLISLAILAGLGFGGWWGWHRLHRSDPASEVVALRQVRKAGTAVGKPLVGVYRYKDSGTDRVGVGPVALSRTLPGRALLVVSVIAGGGRTIDWRLSTDDSEGWQTKH